MRALLSFLLVTIFANAQAQTVTGLGMFENLPQGVYANPAFQPTARYNFGIPALSGVAINHSNNWLRPSSDLLYSDASGNLTLNAREVLAGIDAIAHTGQSASFELFHAGIKVGSHYFRLSAAERFSASIDLPKDIFQLAVYGNVGHNEFENNTADFSGLAVDGLHYREYALGYSFHLDEKWEFGVAAKLLYGMERIRTEESSLTLRTDPDTYDLQSAGAFQVQTSGIYGLTTDESTAVQEDLGNYLLGLKNWGLGGDIGAAFKPNEKWKIEASVLNLGFIKWQSDVATYGTDDASFLYGGLDLTDIIFLEGSDFNDGLQDRIDSLVDVLENTYGFERKSESFNTGINALARYAASYEIYKNQATSGKAWATLTHGLGQSSAPFSIGLGYNQSLKRWLEASVHASYRKDYSPSVGAGLVLNAGPVQFYAMVENFRFAQYSRITWREGGDGEESAVPYFSNASDLRVQFGLNLTFGREELSPKGRPMKR